MWRQLFSETSPYKKRARLAAILWTLLIFIACLTPAKDIPDVPVPLIDKWTHLVLFGTFAFLWLCSRPSIKAGSLFFIFIFSVVLGVLIELLQGYFTALGRSCDVMDAVADAIGGALGIGVFYLCSRKGPLPASPKER